MHIDRMSLGSEKEAPFFKERQQQHWKNDHLWDPIIILAAMQEGVKNNFLDLVAISLLPYNYVW